jgi:uncharacterized membrane protein YhhN
MKTAQFLRLFIFISAGYLLLLLSPFSDLSIWIKPLLLPPLILAVYFHDDFKRKFLLMSALVFSWLGDVALIFAPLSNWYFIAGLLAFLTAHVFYILIFSKEKLPSKTYPGKLQILAFIVILAFFTVITKTLSPHLGEMEIPVNIYALTIWGMLGAAFSGYINWPTPARFWILGGAMSFVLSDTILAFNKFHHPIAMASLMIMLSYLLAQYAITKGILLLQSSN